MLAITTINKHLKSENKKEGVKTLFLTKLPLLQISVTGVIFIFWVF